MDTVQPQNQDTDIPVETRGYITDPKLVGYQILTNYESTYWRCLVGRDAWSLYEVLRSFCHEGKDTCFPSINLLMATLGLKQRRALTGWTTKVRGKRYEYPGLIETLQNHQLVTVKVDGEGPKMRYIFHVNLTPELLTDNQITQLPNVLQKRHAKLIERCKQAQQEGNQSTDTAKVQDQAMDTLIEIRGYVTDPKLVGYQILTNYESTYWRCLVGQDAWSLYEVLRSFCHEGNDTCTPSIQLLMDILGITERRQLTGRVTTLRGEEHVLPGLIDVLQDHKLVAAEMKGEGPTLRYVFHVNLTPPPLASKQVEQLPKIFHRKHAQLLQRVAQNMDKLDKVRRKKPKKRKKKSFPSPGTQPEEGYDNVPGGYDNVPGGGGTLSEGGGTLSYEHYPYNNTQKNNTQRTTTDAESENDDHDRGKSDPRADVVVALTDLKISQRTAQRLAHRYSRERIFEKIDFLAYLQETDPKKVKNPRGWLRTAIEEDYGPPDGYKPKEQREAEAAEKAKREKEIEEAIAAQDGQRALPGGWRAWVVENQSIPEDLQEITHQLQEELKLQMPTDTFSSLVVNTMITRLGETQAHIAVPSSFAHDWLTHRLKPKFEKTLADIIARQVEVEFELVKRPPREEPEE